jgi:hypothetical protein
MSVLKVMQDNYLMMITRRKKLDECLRKLVVIELDDKVNKLSIDYGLLLR